MGFCEGVCLGHKPWSGGMPQHTTHPHTTHFIAETGIESTDWNVFSCFLCGVDALQQVYEDNGDIFFKFLRKMYVQFSGHGDAN